MLGVVSVGEELKTTDPEPVEVVTPVPPLATATVPVTLAAFPLIFPDTLEPANEVIQAGSA